MALAWIILNIVDLALTSKALSLGAREANPVLNYLLGYNYLAFAVGKMAIALGVAGIYEALKSHKNVVYVFSIGNLFIGTGIIYELIVLLY